MLNSPLNDTFLFTHQAFLKTNTAAINAIYLDLSPLFPYCPSRTRSPCCISELQGPDVHVHCGVVDGGADMGARATEIHWPPDVSCIMFTLLHVPLHYAEIDMV